MPQRHSLPRSHLKRRTGQLFPGFFHCQGEGLHLPPAAPGKHIARDLPAFAFLQAVVAQQPVGLHIFPGPLDAGQVHPADAFAPGRLLSINRRGDFKFQPEGIFHLDLQQRPGPKPRLQVPVVGVKRQAPLLQIGLESLGVQLTAEVHGQPLAAGIDPQHPEAVFPDGKIPGKRQGDSGVLPPVGREKAPSRCDIPLRHVFPLLAKKLLICLPARVLPPIFHNIPLLTQVLSVTHSITESGETQQKSPGSPQGFCLAFSYCSRPICTALRLKSSIWAFRAGTHFWMASSRVAPSQNW